MYASQSILVSEIMQQYQKKLLLQGYQECRKRAKGREVIDHTWNIGDNQSDENGIHEN